MVNDPHSPQIWCNGIPQDPENHGLPIHHPAILYGESAFETFKVVKGKPLYLGEHLERLQKTVVGLGLGSPYSASGLEEEVRQALDSLHDAPNGWRVRVTLVSERTALMGLDGKEAPIQRWLMAVPIGDGIGKPLRVSISPFHKIPPGSLPPSWKHGNYLSSLLSLRQAQQRGFDDAILVTESGIVTEGTSANLFWIRDRQLATCSDDLIFQGLTRDRVIRYAESEQIPIHCGHFAVEELRQADEVFFTSSVRGIVPIQRVETSHYSVGDPDSMTMKIARDLRDLDLQEAVGSC